MFLNAMISVTKIFVITVRAWTCHLLCKRPGCYHSTSKTHVRDRIFKLRPMHASVIYHIPWIHWIHWKFYSIWENLQCGLNRSVSTCKEKYKCSKSTMHIWADMFQQNKLHLNEDIFETFFFLFSVVKVSGLTTLYINYQNSPSLSVVKSNSSFCCSVSVFHSGDLCNEKNRD